MLGDSHGEKMDSHGNIIFRTHLGAQNDSGFPVIDDPDFHLVIVSLNECGFLLVLIISRLRIKGQALCFGQSETGGQHVKAPDTDSV